MKAIIAEKPSVAREIASLLGASEKKDGYLTGNGYCVTWAFGHLVGLGMPEVLVFVHFFTIFQLFTTFLLAFFK